LQVTENEIFNFKLKNMCLVKCLRVSSETLKMAKTKVRQSILHRC